jgi:hypothetical protein
METGRGVFQLSDEMKKASRTAGWPLHTVGAIVPWLLDSGHLLGGRTLAALPDREFDPVTFLQRLEPDARYLRVMDKDVIALIPVDKTVSLAVIKPLDGPGFPLTHFLYLLCVLLGGFTKSALKRKTAWTVCPGGGATSETKLDLLRSPILPAIGRSVKRGPSPQLIGCR